MLTMQAVAKALIRDRPLPGRHVLVSAHPDDETISCAALVCAVPNLTIVQLTGWSAERMDERAAALGALGWAGRILDARLRAREVLYHAPTLLPIVDDAIADADAVWTHAYEGGHLDHDTAAWLVQTACERHPGVLRLEFPGYHRTERTDAFGVFWPDATRMPVRVVLKDERWQRKSAAIQAYASQFHILRKFPNWPLEVYREAPTYDFSRPAPPPRSRWDVKGYRPSTSVWRELMAQSREVAA